MSFTKNFNLSVQDKCNIGHLKTIAEKQVFKTVIKKPIDFNPDKCNFNKFVKDHCITNEEINWISFKPLLNLMTIYLKGLYIIEVTLI
jgi:hypothetical protein